MNFTQWLYAHYIQPNIETQKGGQDTIWFSLLLDSLTEDQRTDLQYVLEFWGTRAFLLGLKTGAGLKEAAL